MSDIRLSNSSVTSGTNTNTSGVYSIPASTIDLSWANLINVPPLPGNFVTGSAHATGTFIGWENPAYSVTGVIEEKATDSSFVHLDVLKRLITNNMVQSGVFTQTYLYDDVFAPSGIPVLFDSMSINRVASSTDAAALESTPLTQGTLLNVSLTLREVK